MQKLPEFAFPTERMWLSGYGDDQILLNPTIICKFNGKAYLAVESLNEFASLIQNVTLEEAAALKESLANLKPFETSNMPPVTVVDIEEVKRMREANNPFINKYLDHIEKVLG